jgi:hypothetical protein
VRVFVSRLKSPGFALALILLMALGVRLLTFERSLPYVDYPDEANMFLLAVDWRGDFPLADEYGAGLTGDRLAGYPPLYPAIAISTQHIVEAISPEPFLFSGDYVYGLRLLAVIAGVLTTLALWMIGWSLGGRIAAGLSALVWALSPVVVEWNSLAIPDPLVYLASAWTLAFALWAWHTDNPAWTLPSLLCAIAAIYLKYTPLHVLVAWGLVVLLFLRRDWRRMLPLLIVEMVIGAACAAYLLFGYGALRLQNDEAMRLDPGMALSIERGLRNLYGTLLPVGLWLFVLVVAASIFAYGYSRYRGWMLVDWRKAVFLLLVTAAGVLSVSTFIGVEPNTNQMRHVLPVSVAVIGLWGMAVAQLNSALDYINGRKVGVGLPLFTALFVTLAVRGDLALMRRLEQPDPRYELWQWSDASLPPDGKILMSPDSPLRAVWNRPYSGYDGQTAFEWAFDEAPYESTPQELFDQGVSYFTLSTVLGDQIDPEMTAFLDQLMRLNVFVSATDPDNPTVIEFYRILPPQVQADATFGGQVKLMGYDLDVSGDLLHFRPYWETLETPTANYSMFIHFTPAQSQTPLAQYDGPPASARRPALTWEVSETLIGADAHIEIPEYLPAGDYEVRVGLYNFETGQRLMLDGGADAFVISTTTGE